MALRICAAPKPDLKTLFRSANLWTLSENSTSLLITSEPNPTFRVQRPYSSKKEADIPKNKLQGLITADAQPTNGVCYDKKPFRMLLEAGKRYSWCLCGRSHSQPMCDGTHRNKQLKIEHKPIRFAVEETKEYWLCNCKQTRNRPFCDGTHLSKEVEEMNSIIKP